jgi:hypothetical protein
MVKKFTSAQPTSVQRRFDSIFQSVAVNVDIPPLGASFPERANKAQIQLLYSTLDALAVEMISKSLRKNIVLGEDVRTRFFG